MQRQANTIGVVAAILVSACVARTPAKIKPSKPAPPPAAAPAIEEVPSQEPPKEWCFDTTTVSKAGTPYKSNICLPVEEQCSKLADHYKKTGGLIGVEYISECKAR